MSRAVVAVAASGGRDSTALLHATARAAPALDIQVVALHVHHGLMPQADAWLSQLRRQVSRWRRAGLPLSLLHARLSGQPAPGESVEAWARRQRYEALTSMARQVGATLVLLAHHRQDQAETFLLQALRGGAPRGLASMPASVQRNDLCWARPWLAFDSAAIDAYVRRYGLRHVDDHSNRQPRFDRSRLRHAVWPTLIAAFPDAAAALSTAAARAHEMAGGLWELAEIDAARCVDDRQRLLLEPWLALSSARRANLLRAWLHRSMGRGAPETLVQRMLREIRPGASGSRWVTAGGELLQHRGTLMWRPGGAAAGAIAVDGVLRQNLSTPGVHRVEAWGGRFVVKATPARGVPAAWLVDCELRPRQGGERFQLQVRSMPRSLKKQFQSASVPARDRGGPLVFAGDRLLYVPGLGLDVRACRDGGADLLMLEWVADDD